MATPIRHGKGIPCNQPHVIVVTKIKDITCLACKRLLNNNPELIKELGLETIPVLKVEKDDIIKHLEEGIPMCDKCGSPMRERHSYKGWFWGCGSWPRCKNTKSIFKKD